MSLSLMIALLAFAVLIIISISVLVANGKVPIKYSLLWYLFAILILLIGLIPNAFEWIGGLIGFNPLSDFVVAFILTVLILLNIALTVMIASQRRRINLVSQEVALLKKELKDARNKR